MKWSEKTWQEIETIFNSIITMPFIDELSNGTLPIEKFEFYMAQDALYLEHFGRSLAFIGSKSYEIDDSLTYIKFAENAIIIERLLHESYIKDFKLKNNAIMQPACHHYTSYLKSTAAFDSVEVAMAATLPCFWIYKMVGDYILDNNISVNNPYQKWIDTYGGEEFNASVKVAIDLCDKVAENTTESIRNKMTEAFINSSLLEYDFWDAAYILRKWK